MEQPRLDDALEARPISLRPRRTAGPTIRRRNIARSYNQRRYIARRGNTDSGGGASSDSGLDSGLDSGPESDSDDEVIPVRQSLSTSLVRPSTTLRVGSTLGQLTSSTAGAAQPTPVRFAPLRTTSAALTRPTGLGSTLLVAEGDDTDSGIDSGIEDLSDDEDSDDETTTSVSSLTSSQSQGQTTTFDSVTSTKVALISSSTVPAASPPPAIGTSTSVISSSSGPTQSTTLSTAITTPSASSSSTVSRNKKTRPATYSATLSSATTPTTLPTLSLPEMQLGPTETAIPGQALGSVTSPEHRDMTQGQVAGTVIGVLAGVTVLVIGAFFLIRRLRGRGRHLPSMRNPFSRGDSGDNTTTTGTAWAAPWNREFWGALSYSPRTTASATKKSNKSKTNSEMLDELVQASYAAEGGGSGGFDVPEKTRGHQSDLESQSPPSPGSFLDENFINEKSYASLEGHWPLTATPVPAKRRKIPAAPKTPGPVARWLDGILTPRQSIAAVPPALIPGGGQMATKWQPEPQVSADVGPLQPPAPAFAKGSQRDTRMTETTNMSSSITW